MAFGSRLIRIIIYAIFAATAVFWISLNSRIDKEVYDFISERKLNIKTFKDSFYINQHEDELSEKDKSPPFIIVMTQWRFGSSVLGELFNQNSDLFYIFESLWPTTKLREAKGIIQYTTESKNLSRKILRDFAKCEFDSGYLKILHEWGGHVANKVLCHNSTSCRMESPRTLGDFCKKFQGRLATKILHADLDLLKPLVEDDGINLKIIHLVRDPRAAIASRIDYLMNIYPKVTDKVKTRFSHSGRLSSLGLLDFTPKYMLSIQEMTDNNPTAQGMCQWIRENIKTSPDQIPRWLRGRYHLVKYEDFAESPLKVTREIYKFIGMPLKAEVEQWVQENTHPSKSIDKVFSTRKDSRKRAKKWMKDLTVLEASQIAAECADVLKILGYDMKWI